MSQPRILVIDDDPDLQNLVVSLLKHAGFECVSALTASAGAEILRQRPLPDCVLLDLMLPDVSGLELLRQIRSLTLFDDLPVVILSALADPTSIRKGLDLGADRYLTKPYLANNLINTLVEVLRSGRRVSST
ncbi:MAG: response regulator [Anaerolineae bacterium]|nr:response regulator [Anaerolineae bacterium]